MSWTTAPCESRGVSVRPSEATDFSRGSTCCWISSPRTTKFGSRRSSHLCVNDRGIYRLVDINFLWTHGRSCWAILLRQFIISIAQRHIRKKGKSLSTWQPIFLSNKLTRDYYGRRPAPGAKSTPVAMGNASLGEGEINHQGACCMETPHPSPFGV